MSAETLLVSEIQRALSSLEVTFDDVRDRAGRLAALSGLVASLFLTLKDPTNGWSTQPGDWPASAGKAAVLLLAIQLILLLYMEKPRATHFTIDTGPMADYLLKKHGEVPELRLAQEMLPALEYNRIWALRAVREYVGIYYFSLVVAALEILLWILSLL